jgi:ABC-2 type transport system ATP-binding protein
MIKVTALTKQFGPLTAVDGLSFAVPPGRVTGFLGPNGAGKTTTLRCALDLERPTAGSVSFDGRRYRSIRHPMREIGASLEASSFNPARSAIGHLRVLAPQVGVSRARCEEVLSLVGLADVAGRAVGKFSTGMRARLGLASALLGDPATILLDEPVNGLDPEGIRWMRSLLRGFAAQGRTVLISSHILSEVQQTVDDVVIIARGKLLAAGPLAGLEAAATHLTYVEAGDPAGFGDLARARGWRFTPDGAGLVIDGPAASEIGEAAQSAGLALHQLATRARGLEGLFMSLTEGQGLAEVAQ